MSKIKVEMDLKDFGADLEYPFEQTFKEELLCILRDELRKVLAAEAEEHLRKWIKEEFLQEGKCEVRDGVVYVPLLLKDIQHG